MGESTGPTASELIDAAFSRLAEREGYVERPDQVQLARLIGDLIGEQASGTFEAPTGLGKSLAALIPAAAHAITDGKRTVIATYTNVLAEQYWRTDVPLARALFEEGDKIRAQLLMGRSRYVCIDALREAEPELVSPVRLLAGMGTEQEFRTTIGLPTRQANALWQKVSAPPVCPGRLCSDYDDCFYYRARRNAERAHIVITNHSVVLMDAILKRSVEGGDGLLGDYDFLILDEAHDFPQAAVNALEFELSTPKLGALLGVAGRLEQSLTALAKSAGAEIEWHRHVLKFREAIDNAQLELVGYGTRMGRTGILDATPPEVLEHPQVKASRSVSREGAEAVASMVSEACAHFITGMKNRLAEWTDADPERAKTAKDAIVGYSGYIGEYGIGCKTMFSPRGIAVSYVGDGQPGPILRQDVVDLAEPLQELIWNQGPYVCLSATLAVDGNFEFFERITGAKGTFEEILPTPFDFSTQAALYLPPEGRIPDPTIARKEGYEDAYFDAVAREIEEIILNCGGRTLALFHSRREMEAVFNRITPSMEFPILMQTKFGATGVGDRFKANETTSLFGLRSFWTGFDAPGTTLSCVILVRIPFEVPIDPLQIARLAYMQTQGRDGFFEYSLPNATMLMRQGAGRLIRRAGDRGIITILDPRVMTKRYGEQLLANLPPDMRTFRDLTDAIGYIGLDGATPGSEGSAPGSASTSPPGTASTSPPGTAGDSPASGNHPTDIRTKDTKRKTAGEAPALPGEAHWHNRGYLPHWEGGEIPQHVVFRLADSLPKALLGQWESELSQMPQKEMEQQRRRYIERALDHGHGKRYLSVPEVARVLQETLLKFDGDRYQLFAWTIMPNHVHVLFAPKGTHTLSSILHTWKSFTAHEANQMLNRTGDFWQDEYFDRFIRTEEHFLQAKQYIEENPVKAGLCDTPSDWPYGSAYTGQGLHGAGPHEDLDVPTVSRNQ